LSELEAVTPQQKAIKAILERICPPDEPNQGCDCCMKEPSVGVASIPFVPMSICWGRKCLDAGVVPLWICFAQVEMASEGAPEGTVFGREMFNEYWLSLHDATLAYFEVTEEEFWEACNA